MSALEDRKPRMPGMVDAELFQRMRSQRNFYMTATSLYLFVSGPPLLCSPPLKGNCRPLQAVRVRSGCGRPPRSRTKRPSRGRASSGAGPEDPTASDRERSASTAAARGGGIASTQRRRSADERVRGCCSSAACAPYLICLS